MYFPKKKRFQKQNFYFSDDVQLSSEAMGVYELQASPKFKSLNELIGGIEGVGRISDQYHFSVIINS